MKEKPCIRIGHMKLIDHLILGIADSQLKNRESELKHCTVEALEMNSWSQLSDALASGETDGAFINAPLGMELFLSGLDIRLLMLVHRAGSIIVKKKGAGIRTLPDLKGKTVLIPSRLSIQNMLLHRLLSSASLRLGSHDEDQADVVGEVANPYLMPEMLADDSDNDIAGFAVADPYGSQSILEKTAEKVCTSNDLWKSHPCCVFAAHKNLVDEFPEAFQEIIALFISTAQKIQDMENEILSRAGTFLSIDEKTVRKIIKDTAIKFDPDLLVPDMDSLETINRYMKNSMGLLDSEIDFNSFVDNSFIKNSIAEKKSLEY